MNKDVYLLLKFNAPAVNTFLYPYQAKLTKLNQRCI